MRSVSYACENSIHIVNELVWESWKERLLAERLIRKSKVVRNYLQQSNHHWEEAFWWLLARNFGMTVNADAFEAIAKSIPISILAKHKNQIHQLEGLLFGQLVCLMNPLTKTIQTCSSKNFNFTIRNTISGGVHARVFFLRMRPGNFPTIRLAQLATLVYNQLICFQRSKMRTR